MSPRENTPHSPERSSLNPPEVGQLIRTIIAKLAAVFGMDAVVEEMRAQKTEIREEVDRLLRVEITTDTQFVKKSVLGSFLHLIPDEKGPLAELKTIISNAMEHPSLSEQNGRPEPILITPATGSWKNVENPWAKGFAIRNLFDESLGKLSSPVLKSLRRTSLFRLIEQARPAGVQEEVISLMGLFIDILETMIREKIHELHVHVPDSTSAHQQLMTLEERVEVYPETARINLLSMGAFDEESELLQKLMKKRMDDHWKRRQALHRNAFWKPSVEPAINPIEKDFDTAQKTLVPNQLAPVDLLDDRYYLLGMVRSARDGNDSLLEALQQNDLSELLHLKNPVLGSFQGIRQDIQLMTIPQQRKDESLLNESEQKKAFANRVIIGMMPFKPFRWYEKGEQDLEEPECLAEDELWWIYAQVRQAFEKSKSLEEVFDALLPGMDAERILSEQGRSSILKDRFRRLSKASDAFFKREEQPTIGLIMEVFFYSAAHRDKNTWEKGNFFEVIKQSFPPRDEEVERRIEKAQQSVMDGTSKLSLPVRQFEKKPELMEEFSPYLHAWREHDGTLRLEVLEAIMKRDPRLEGHEGHVMMDALSHLPFPELPENSFGFPVLRENGLIYWVWWPATQMAAL